MAVTRSGGMRSGFTMIECTAALALFSIIVLMWQPILHTATHLRPQDEELVQLLAAQRELEDLAAGGSVSTQSGKLVLLSAAGKRYEVNYYESPANGHIIRMTTASGGYMPLIANAADFQATTLADGTAEYTIRLATGDEVTGVLTASGEKDVEKSQESKP